MITSLAPRFAVLPASETDSPDVDFLRQIGVTPLFWQVRDGDIVFDTLAETLAERLGA
jgi:hypothetical protein